MVQFKVSIMALANSTGTFAPYTNIVKAVDQTQCEINNKGHLFHQIDLKYNKIDVNDYIKWCRRNLGDRGSTWDFWMAGGILYIEVWGDKAKFTYEMWKN